jgi:hypothetical protein
MDLLDNDIDLILKEISKTDNVLSYSKKELLRAVNEGIVSIIKNDNEIIGLSIHKNINYKWTELSLLLIFSKYRRKGHGQKTYNETRNLLKDNSLYCCSKNPIIQDWLITDGFVEVSCRQLPRVIIMHLLKTKFKSYKLIDLLRKGSINDWNHYIRK